MNIPDYQGRKCKVSVLLCLHSLCDLVSILLKIQTKVNHICSDWWSIFKYDRGVDNMRSWSHSLKRMKYKSGRHLISSSRSNQFNRSNKESVANKGWTSILYSSGRIDCIWSFIQKVTISPQLSEVKVIITYIKICYKMTNLKLCWIHQIFLPSACLFQVIHCHWFSLTEAPTGILRY